MNSTYFFSHDYDARNDPKLQSLLMVHGVAGIGIYWCIIEQLYQQNGYLPLTACNCIAFALHVDIQSIQDIINDFALFEHDDNRFWSGSVLERLGKRASLIEKRKAAAATRWTATNAQAMHKQCTSNSNVSSRKPKTVDYKLIVDMYHEFCPSYGKILRLSDARKQKIAIRMDEMKGDYELLKKIFVSMEKSKFLKGDNRSGWKASFDWIFENPKNWLKVAEGNYANKKVSQQTNINANDEWK